MTTKTEYIVFCRENEDTRIFENQADLMEFLYETDESIRDLKIYEAKELTLTINLEDVE